MKKEIIKPFSLEAWKNGAKIKTRDGHEARIICTDAKNEYYPILGLVAGNGDEHIVFYTLEGKLCRTKSAIRDEDLVIVEEVEEPEFWSDRENKKAKGYYIDYISDIIANGETRYNRNKYNLFATKKQAKSALAMARISQIMANDVEHFGGVVTDEEWKKDELKYIIYREHNKINTTFVAHEYQFLAFHSAAQRDLFLEKYHDLVRDFLMID